MATSGVINSSSYDNTYLKLTWRTTQDIASNSTTLSWTLSAVKGSGTTYYAGGFKVTIGGSVEYEYTGSRYLLRDGHEIASGSKVITHNADGTKAIDIKIEGAVYTYAISCTGSQTIQLEPIARTSSISVGTAYIGSYCNITIHTASSALTHTLVYSFGNISDNIAYQTSQSSINWFVPIGLYYQIPDSKSGTANLTCYTYSGGTLIGTESVSFTVMAREADCKPEISVTLTELNTDAAALSGGQYIKYVSDVKCEAAIYPAYGASIVSQSLSYGSKSTSETSITIEDIDINSIVVTATDSRGYTTTQTVRIPLLDYVPLTCDLSDDRPDTEGNYNFYVTGNYFNSSFPNRANSLLVEYRYGVAGGEYTEWTRLTPTITDNTYSAPVSITGLDYKTTYDFQARAVDELMIVYNTDTPPIRSTPVFDWSGEDFNFNVPVHFNFGATGLEDLVGEGGSSMCFFGTCDTDASEQYKYVICPELEGKELVDGMSLKVLFANENGVANVWLNINGEKFAFVLISDGYTVPQKVWRAGEVVEFVYYSGGWNMLGATMATTEYSGNVRLVDEINFDSTSALTPHAVFEFIRAGDWIPQCNAIPSPTQAIGTFIKVRDNCIVSWCIYGTATYQQYITISGLPYTPHEWFKWQSGGGCLSNCTTPANQVFSGWNIENGLIYARTSSTSTSSGSRASGYASSGGGVTLYCSGTICYRLLEQ